MTGILNRLQNLLDTTRTIDFLAPLALRLYLVPIFWMAGTHKLENAGLDCLNTAGSSCSLAVKQDVIDWFANPDWGLGLPFPELLAYLAAYTEYFGAILLLVGLAVRWIALPLMVTMIVAAVTVHWQNGWPAIADASGLFVSERIQGAAERLDRAKDILQEHGNYSWLTENGSFVVLNNGIEFAATYFIMLLVLFFTGAGRFFSMDYWVAHYRGLNSSDRAPGRAASGEPGCS
jgi:uncharacterized membrane protein YphA (DoxX/SURF4 family)